MRRGGKSEPAAPPVEWASLRPVVTDALLHEIVDRVVAAFAPEQIVLFGSYAYGTPDLNSDLDLLVVMDSDEPMARRITRVSAAAQVPFLPMDVLVYTPAEVRERLAKGDFFLSEILAQGRVLYQRECG